MRVQKWETINYKPPTKFFFRDFREKKKIIAVHGENITLLQSQIFNEDGEESVSAFNDPRERKRKKKEEKEEEKDRRFLRWKRVSFVGKYSANELVTQIHDQRASLTTNVRAPAPAPLNIRGSRIGIVLTIRCFPFTFKLLWPSFVT